MSKKAPKLEDILGTEIEDIESLEAIVEQKTIEPKKEVKKQKVSNDNKTIKSEPDIKITTLKLPTVVKDQLEHIWFTEKSSGQTQNDLILEGIDLLFKNRGFPSVKKLLANKS